MTLIPNRTTLTRILTAGLAVIGALLGLLIIKELVELSNSEYIRIVAGAFTGSSIAGIIYFFIYTRLDYFPLLYIRNHVIICGLNYRSMLIIEDLVKNGIKPVIIDSDGKNIYVESVRNLGLLVLNGSPSSSTLLNKAGIQKAKYVLSFDDADEKNADIAMKIMQIMAEKNGDILTCIIQIVNPQLYMIIKKHSFSNRQDSRVKIEFHNQYAIGARILLEKFPPFRHGSDITDDPLPIIIIGAGQTG